MGPMSSPGSFKRKREAEGSESGRQRDLKMLLSWLGDGGRALEPAGFS